MCEGDFIESIVVVTTEESRRNDVYAGFVTTFDVYNVCLAFNSSNFVQICLDEVETLWSVFEGHVTYCKVFLERWDPRKTSPAQH